MKPWPAFLPFFLAVACGLCAVPLARSAEPLIAVLHGELSVKPSDRGYSRAMARNMVRWLDDAGLTPADFPDSQTAAALAPPRRVAHLVNIDDPPREVLAGIDAFLARGGKLVVYNSASQALATRLGVTVGRYRAAPTFGHWAQFRFTQPAPLHMPPVVRQSSASLREAMPSIPATRVAAWWEDRQGTRTPYAAWLQHASGFWMTHVLVEDEDGESRRRLLTAVSGACSISVWRTASDTLLARLGALVGAPDYPSAVCLLRSRCTAPRRAALDALAREMDAVYGKVLDDRKRGLHAAATVKLWQLRGLLIEAYATIQEPWSNSIRAVWDHEGFGLFLGDWNATCATLARFGVTDLFVLVATPSTTHATVPGLVATPLRRDHGDQLALAIDAARSHRLRVHAWIIALSADGMSPKLRAEYGEAGRLLVDGQGKRRNWLDPRHADNRSRLRDTVAHLATKYAVDGIHLDYIRYPDFQSTLGTSMRTGYERQSGAPVQVWPRDVMYSGRPRYKGFVAYRAEGITTLVDDARRTLKTRAPRVELSAAVYGRYPLCVDSVGQDWMAWLRDGLLDYAAPMNYASNMAQYRTYLEDQSRVPELRKRILTGIGVTAAESNINGTLVIDQLDAARDRGFGGYALFDLNATLRLEILPVLRLGFNGR